MPSRSNYSFLPLRTQKPSATSMKQNGLPLEKLPRRTRADEIAHNVLDNSVKKNRQTSRLLVPSRRLLLLGGIIGVVIVVVVVVTVLAVTLTRDAADVTPNPEGLLSVPADVDGVLYIRYNASDRSSYEDLVHELDATWLRYERRGVVRPGMSSCNISTEGCPPRTADPFDLATLGASCSHDRGYGYKVGMPCVLLQLKVPLNWKPQNCLVPPPPPQSEDAISNANTTTTVPPTTTVSPSDIKVTCLPAIGNRTTKADVMSFPSDGFARGVLKQRSQTGYMDPLVMLWFVGFSQDEEYSAVCSVCPGYVGREGAAPDKYSLRITLNIVS